MLLRPRFNATIDPKRRALDYRIGGGVALGVATMFIIGAVVVTSNAASYRPQQCDPADCIDLSGALHELQVELAVGLWVVGAAAAVTGSVLLHLGERWAAHARPSLTLGPHGGVAGVSLTF
jgi:hypothetical protein